MTMRIRTASALLLAGATMSMPLLGQVDRTLRPRPQPTPRIVLPEIQKTRLSNGLAVWLVEHRELPIVALNLVFQSGSDRDPAAKAGIASMTSELLDEGTTSRTSLAIADELESIGAVLSARSGTDGSFVMLSCLTKHLPSALDVFADVLTDPVFPAGEFERLRNQRVTSLMQQRDRPATIASLAFSRLIYGQEHPYGRDASGTEQSLAAMTRDDLVAFYSTHYRPNNAVLIAVGDIALPDLVRHLESRLGPWKAGDAPPAAFPATPAATRRTVYLIDKPEAPQSEIRIGYPAAARSTPDFFPLTLANRVLGGQFASRLNLNIREKRGFSYGVRSAFQFSKQPGPFVASGGVIATKTDSALFEFLYEIDKVHESGITQEELEFVRKGLAGNFALTFETPGQIAGSMQNLVLYDLPDDYYEKYLENLDAVSLDRVKEVSARYFDSSRMAVVVVGDLKLVRNGIEGLNLGEIVLCDVDGKPLTR